MNGSTIEGKKLDELPTDCELGICIIDRKTKEVVRFIGLDVPLDLREVNRVKTFPNLDVVRMHMEGCAGNLFEEVLKAISRGTGALAKATGTVFGNQGNVIQRIINVGIKREVRCGDPSKGEV